MVDDRIMTTSAGGDSGSSSNSSSTFPTAITTAIALVVAGLAAVGLTGEPLLRAVRNSPWAIAIFISLAVVGAVLFVIGQFWPELPESPPPTGSTAPETQQTPPEGSTAPRDAPEASWTWTAEGRTSREPPGRINRWWSAIEARNKVRLIGVGFIAGSIIFAVFVGALAVRARERPLVTLQAAPVAAAPSAATAGSKSGTIELTVTAHATSLTTDHEMLVQVIGLLPDPATMSEPPAPPKPTPAPEPSQAIPYAAAELCESNHTYRDGTSLDPAKGRVLLWDRFGPKADGSVDATWKIQVMAGEYAYVCAWAPIGGQLSRDDIYANSAAYLRLK